jgi:hypothetical protein
MGAHSAQQQRHINAVEGLRLCLSYSC